MIVFLYAIIIFFTNIIQGVTGFAGTLLAMPFLMLFIDKETVKQSLNLIGLLASIVILYKDYRYITWSELKKMILFMVVGMLIGLGTYQLLPERLLFSMFSLFILFIGVQGLLTLVSKKCRPKKNNDFLDLLILVSAGVIHGLFISGGPLLISYASNKITNKRNFRATLSMIWLILNSFIFFQSIILKQFQTEAILFFFVGVIPLIIGIFIGSKLLNLLSQRIFMLISYSLLTVSSFVLMINNL